MPAIHLDKWMKSSRYLAVAAILLIGGAVTTLTCIKKSTAHTSQSTSDRIESIWGNGFRKSTPAYREAEKLHEWMWENKKLEAAGRSSREIDSIRFGGQIPTDAVARLPDEVLESYMPLFGRILNSLDTKTCAAFVNGKLKVEDLKPYAYPVIESFNDAEAKTWFAANRLAIDAMLDNLPVIVLPKEKGKQGLLAVAASLPADQTKSFLQRLATLMEASDADQCAAFRTVYAREPSLTEPYRGYVARLLLTGKAGRGEGG
jgi:hypothetical protein